MIKNDLDCSVISNCDPCYSEFALLYARFEYSLKESGFCKYENNRISIQHDNLIKKIDKNFFDKLSSSGCANTIISSPPSKQILDGNKKLIWKTCSPPKCNQTLMEAVIRVRNNLLHGGKSGNPDQDRNINLVKESIFVIKQLIVQCEDFKYTFEGKY